MRVPPVSSADSTIMAFSPVNAFQMASPARTAQGYPAGAEATLSLVYAAAIRTLAPHATRACPGSQRIRSLGTTNERLMRKTPRGRFAWRKPSVSRSLADTLGIRPTRALAARGGDALAFVT